MLAIGSNCRRGSPLLAPAVRKPCQEIRCPAYPAQLLSRHANRQPDHRRDTVAFEAFRSPALWSFWHAPLPCGADREHVLAIVVQLDVVAAAQPSYIQRFVVAVMMGIDRAVTADFTALLLQSSRHERPLDSKMGGVFAKICAAPVRLASLTFQRRWSCGFRVIRYHGVTCDLDLDRKRAASR